MNFFELPASKQWAALKYRGEHFADVWFKPEGEPHAIIFRIPQASFQLPGIDQSLTTENLLKAVNITPQEIASWRQGDVSQPTLSGTDPDIATLLTPPRDAEHLEIFVRLNSQTQSEPASEAAESSTNGAAVDSGATSPDADDSPPLDTAVNHADAPADIPAEEVDATAAATSATNSGDNGVDDENSEMSLNEWQDLDLRWKAILGLEAVIDTLRIEMEGVQAEMESSLSRNLTIEEKTHALRGDIAQWNTAKNRVRFTLPKVRDYIHRAVWALGDPERKRLAEIHKDHIEPQIPFPNIRRLLPQLESLQKNRQVLGGQGQTVAQEAKGIASNVQTAYRTLQINAAANAKNKRDTSSGGGKFFKNVRRWSGADGG